MGRYLQAQVLKLSGEIVLRLPESGGRRDRMTVADQGEKVSEKPICQGHAEGSLFVNRSTRGQEAELRTIRLRV